MTPHLLLSCLLHLLMATGCWGYSEYFSTSKPFDLSTFDITYTPKGSRDYSICVYPRDTGKTWERHTYTLLDKNVVGNCDADDCATGLSFEGHGAFNYGGQSYTQIYFNSNGLISFDGATTWQVSTFFSSPRIAPYFSDMDPREIPLAMRGWVEKTTASNSVVVSYNNIKEWNSGYYTSFQAELNLNTQQISFFYSSSSIYDTRVGLSFGGSTTYDVDLTSLASIPILLFTFGAITGSSITVTFSEAPYAENYYVTCYRVGLGLPVWSTTTSSTTVTATGLSSATDHYFTVQKSCSKWDNSEYRSNSVSSPIRTTMPTLVTNLAATSTSDAITFTWSAPLAATAYKCEFTNGGKLITMTVTTTSVGFGPLTSYTSYTLKVYSGIGTIFDTNYASVTVMTKPTPVTNVHTSMLDYNRVTVSWTPVNGNRFEIVLKDGAHIVAAPLGIASSSYTFSGLQAEKTYTVTVYAGSLASGYENVGTSVSFVTLPSSVTGLTLTSRSGTKLTFSWAAILGASYRVTLDGEKEQILSTPSATFSSLSLSTSYTVRVHPGKGSFFSSSSSQATATTYGSPATNVHLVTSASDSLTFEWDAPTGAVSYNLVLTGDNGPYTVNDVTATTRQFSSLSPYTQYTLKVYTGFNEGKVYEATGASSPAVQTLVGQATNILRTNVDTNAMSFQWTLPGGASKSRVLLGSQIQELTAGINIATFTGLTGNTEYTLTIYCANQLQDYENVGVNGKYTTLPLAPSVITVDEVTIQTISVSWQAVPGASTYQVSIHQGTILIESDETNSLSATFDDLTEGIQYTITVKSGILGVGYQSIGKSIMQTTSLNTVSNLRCTTTQSSIEYTWGAGQMTTSYRLTFNGLDIETSLLVHNFLGLASGTSYALRIYAGSPGSYSSTYTELACKTLPSAPQNLRTTGSTNTFLSFAWDASSGATIYELILEGSGQATQSSTTIETTKTFGGLVPGLSYKLTVRAGIESGFEPTGISLTTSTLPGLVSNLRLKNRLSDGLEFEWDSVEGATGYRCKLWLIQSGNGMAMDIVRETTSVKFESLESAQIYVVEIYTANEIGTNTNYRTITERTLPASVTNLQVSSVTSISGKLTWNQANLATQYEIKWVGNGVTLQRTLGQVTTADLTELTPETSYEVTIFSGDVNGFENIGKSLTFTTRPDVVGTLSCSEPTAASFKLNWGKVDGATRYRAEIVGKAGMEQTETSKVFSSLDPATPYSVVVFSGNADGFENVGSYGSCTTLTGPPSAMIKTQSTSTSLTFQWTQVNGANMYRVELLDAENVVVSSDDVGDVNMYTFDGLPPNTPYTCNVFAGILNVGFEGNGITLDDVDVRTTPLSPSNVDVVFFTSTSIEVEWDVSDGATGYRVDLYLEQDLYNFANLGPVTNHTFENLLPFSNYTIVVKAINAGGTELTGASVTERTYPAVIRNLFTNSPIPTSIHVALEPSSNTKYCKVQLHSGDGKMQIDEVIVGLDELDVTFSDLTPNTPYLVRVFSGMDMNDYDSLYVQATQYTISEPLQDVAIHAATSTSIIFAFELTDGTTGILVNFLNGTGGEVIERDFITEFSTTRRSDGKTYGTVGGLSPVSDYVMELVTISAGGSGELGFEISFTTFPQPVMNFVGSGNGTTAVFTWNAIDGDDTVYRISRFSEDMTFIDSSLDIYETEFVYKGLVSEVPYQFQIYICVTGKTPACSSEGPTILVSTNTIACPPTPESNSYWNSITSGYEQTGICNDGYFGTPTRFCDEEFGWGPISNPCVPIPPHITETPKIVSYPDYVIISWVAPPFATLFKVSYRVNYFGNPYLLAGETNEPTIRIDELEIRTEYEFAIFSGNGGGFETSGIYFKGTTSLNAPMSLVASEVTTNSVKLGWRRPPKVGVYRVMIQGGKYNSSTFLGDEYTETRDVSYIAEDLEPGTEYVFNVYSGVLESVLYLEPVGSSIIVTTEGAASGLAGRTGVIIGIVVGLALLLILLVIVAILYRRRKGKNVNDPQMFNLNTLESHDSSKRNSRFTLQSQSQLSVGNSVNGSPFYGMNTTGSDLNMRPGDVTLMNTMMEISTPGFLKLDFHSQLRLVGDLGSGGAGTVKKGELIDKRLQMQHQTQFVAVKEVHSWPNLSTEENLERFLQEVSVIWSVTFHPNIVKLVGYTEEPMTIITKIYQTDLGQYLLVLENPMNSDIALNLIRGVANGMATINNFGIAHRDLKSANILLDYLPNPYGTMVLHPVICDFGLARIFRDVTLENQQFVAVSGVSPRYAAPEVFARLSSNTLAPDLSTEIKADVYSLGIIIWDILSRQAAWEGLGPKEIESNVRGGKRPPLPPHCTNTMMLAQDPYLRVLTELMQVCWNGQPQMRPTFQQIVEQLSV